MNLRTPIRGVLRRAAACRTLASLAFVGAACLPALADEPEATVTFVEGRGTVVSGARSYLPAAGMRLRQCDIVSTGPQALLQAETDDGASIILGPDTRTLFGQPHAGDAVLGPHYLGSGWLKLSVPKRDKGLAARINTPLFGLLVDDGVAVVRMADEGGQFFVERGRVTALEPGVSAGTPVAAGRFYARKSGQDKGTLAERPPPDFINAMPRALRDSLPSMLAKVKSRTVQPAPGAADADAEQWAKAEPELRRCFADIRVRQVQEALERLGLKVGPLDGVHGPRTRAALREYQQGKGLEPSGQIDAETLQSLGIGGAR